MVEQKVVNHASEGQPYAVLFWLGETLADHTAEGDLMQLARNGALRLFFSFLIEIGTHKEAFLKIATV